MPQRLALRLRPRNNSKTPLSSIKVTREFIYVIFTVSLKMVGRTGVKPVTPGLRVPPEHYTFAVVVHFRPLFAMIPFVSHRQQRTEYFIASTYIIISMFQKSNTKKGSSKFWYSFPALSRNLCKCCLVLVEADIREAQEKASPVRRLIGKNKRVR